MIDFIIKYQNSYVYANLFKYNLVSLIKTGVDVAGLFESKIMNTVFDYIEWPSTHHQTEKIFAGFNDSIFRLRKKYKHCYPQLLK